MNLIRKIFDICDNYIFQIQKFCSIIFVEHSDSSFLVIGGTFMIKGFFAMLNLLLMTLGSGSSPDPNIYYRTRFYHFRSGLFIFQHCFIFDADRKFLRLVPNRKNSYTE